MAIHQIEVSNFKSFAELKLRLQPLGVVVGANAAGKSNFLEIFRFLRDFAAHGLENAVSLQGGLEYLTNLRIGSGRPASFKLMLHWGFTGAFSLGGQDDPSGLEPGKEDVLLQAIELAGGISVFDFDTKLPKKAMPVSGKAALEPDGSNLALVLRRILQEPQSRGRFIRLLKDVLPFVEDLRVEHFADSLLIGLREQYTPASYLPAAFLSDGTIHVIALIVALYFGQSGVVLIEEPERNIHPALISKVAGMLKDASRHKQVIVTTHNPELVKHVDLENLLLIHRDEEGFSQITRPAENGELRIFLENDLGVDELYVQNLLGVGNAV